MAHLDIDKLLQVFKEAGVSEHNQEIAIDYLQSIQRIGRSQSTLVNNTDFIKWLTRNVKTDLDKLTRRDVNRIQDQINDMKRLKDGKPVADTTKQLYKISLKRFLKKFGKELDNQDMVRLAEFEMAPAKPTRLKPEDILTDEEIDVILSKCKTLRDKVILALMAESGARVGEIANCTLHDVTDCPYGFYVVLRGKTGERTVIIYKSQQLLRQWLAAHPDHDNPDAPLFPTTRTYTEDSYKDKELRRDTLPRQYRLLTRKQIAVVLDDAVERAGIKKRVYPHLFRHSAATRFATILQEQEMKVQLGWVSTSPMPGVYTHLNSKDVEKKLLNAYGVKPIIDEKGEIVRKCPRCSKPITAGILYCECGMPTTQEGVQEFNKLLSNDQFMMAMMKLNKELGQMDLEKPNENPRKDGDDWW